MIDRFLLVIGAMKAGTTTLYELLAQHPRIAPCREKEPEFLCDPKRWHAGLAEYEKLWQWRPGRHLWALEASTSYAKFPAKPSAALATWRYGVPFRFVYVVRDPLARIRSEYLHSLAEGWVPEPIHRGLAPHVVLHSNYRMQLAPYIAAHGRDAILVLSYDELVQHPLAVTRRVWTWLGLEDAPLVEVGRCNAGDLHRAKLMAKLVPQFGGDVEAATRELERWITPSAEQAATIRSLLATDLELFRDEWGIDVWSKRDDRLITARAG